MTDGEQRMIEEQRERLRLAQVRLAVWPRWRWWARIDRLEDVQHESGVLAILLQDTQRAASLRAAVNGATADADALLLRCLDFFRNFDLERTDGRGPSPIVADLVESLESRGVEIPEFPPKRGPVGDGYNGRFFCEECGRATAFVDGRCVCDHEDLGVPSNDTLDTLAEEVAERDGLHWDRSRGLIYERARELWASRQRS